MILTIYNIPVSSKRVSELMKKKKTTCTLLACAHKLSNRRCNPDSMDSMEQMCQKKKKGIEGEGEKENATRWDVEESELCSRRKAIKRSHGSNRAGRLSPESLTVSGAHE